MPTLEEQIRRIQPYDRELMQILAVFFEPLPPQDCYKLLRELGVRAPDGGAYSIPKIALFRKTYTAKHIIRDAQGFSGKGMEIADPELRETLMREVGKTERFPIVVGAIQTLFPESEYRGWYSFRESRKLRVARDFRISLYRKDVKSALALKQDLESSWSTAGTEDVLLSVFSNPFQKDFLNEFPFEIQSIAVPVLLEAAARKLQPSVEIWEFVESKGLGHFPGIKALRISDLLLKGRLEEVKSIIGAAGDSHETGAAGVVAFLERDFAKAAAVFDAAVKLWRKDENKRKGYPDTWEMFFFGLALQRTDPEKFLKFAEAYRSFAAKEEIDQSVSRAVDAVDYFLRNQDRNAIASSAGIFSARFHPMFLKLIVATILGETEHPTFLPKLLEFATASGYDWIRLEILNFLKSTGETKHDEELASLKTKLGFEPVGNLFPRLSDWERALNTLEIIAKKRTAASEPKNKADETRVAWLVDIKSREIQPVEQKFNRNGWTAGRNISLKRLKELDVKNLTDQDARVVKKSLKRHQYYYNSYEYIFSWQSALKELVGHPYLFSLENPSVPIQLNHAEPNLVIKEVGDNLELSFDVRFKEEGIVVRKETETRYNIVSVTKEHVEIFNLLTGGKLRVPREGRDKLLTAIKPLTNKLAIQSDLEEHFENLPSVEADSRIHALVTPAGEGFHLEFFVKPFGNMPPYFKPGKGNESVIAPVDGTRTRAKRDLRREREMVAEIEEICPFLAGFESPNYDWTLNDAQDCLEALSELETPRETEKLVVEWPKGQKLNLLGRVNFNDLSMSVKGANNWFEIDGKVKVNEDLVLTMREFSRHLTEEDRQFIELSDGQFIAVTEKLRKHLRALKSVTDDKGRFHSLRSGILEDLADELEDFKADKAWKENLKRLKAAQAFVPELPKTFEAELRPYQLEGYEWLSRLANWGVGACLADDMGLGKTVMALALLVERAEKGPALVAAPVSVCRNWIKEARRFAPTLNFMLFGEGDRAEMVRSLGKYDVLVTSYNLLQAEEGLFTAQEFATVVLDEAQAVKNRTTKRSKAVMNLKADFRVVTTGTPIENHLGELWNLFNFINPHLLGSHDFFTQKFALPIAKNNDENARKTLQRLIRPFILRRRKNQVLDDLPEKTEITLTVEMSAEERAFYEATRLEALERIEADAGAASDKRFRILAELTRLRLACCHPKLVNENIPLGSSKLELFGETLGELLEGRHKALVFSQFVKHLAIVREYLESKGIEYHYLDGSTPADVRQERIDAFQRGSGDVFLISLKAGGTGLNLTAADYVIHLDPWWNPAVEDQATDRAHRIGQQRPITVYRFVTEDSVEEKIVRLHETKRDLADGLLDGTDASGKLSADDLLNLIAKG